MQSSTGTKVRDLSIRGKLTVIGDLHGKVGALDAIFAERNLEAELAGGSHTVIFLGDLVDRGPVENEGGVVFNVGAERVLDRVIHLTRQYPDQVATILGNHEMMHLTDILERGLGPGDISVWGHEGKLRLTVERIDFLCHLPLVLRFSQGGSRTIVVHGGVPERPFSLDALARDPAGVVDLHERKGIRELLWTNPSWSARMSSFGFAYTRIHLGSFLEENRSQVLIRGHRDEPQILELPGGCRFICVHSARGDKHRDHPDDGYAYLAWDHPAVPDLRIRGPH